MAIDGLAIEIKGLYKIFGKRGASWVDAVKAGMSKTELLQKHNHVLGLKDINLSIPAGQIQVIMGLSGSGKSTLIRPINRLIDPTAGEVIVGDRDVVKMSAAELREFRRHSTAMVFQKFALLPHRTVLENTVYGLEIQGVARKRQLETAESWLKRVGLEGFESKYPNQLSGGMQQRVGLARALANDAPILLMDEAFSALDPLIRVDMQSVLLGLQKEIRKTIVFITHDLDEALRLGDQIAILRDGMMVQQGSAQDIVMNPADQYVSSFVREVNRGKVIEVDSVMAEAGNAPPAPACRSAPNWKKPPASCPRWALMLPMWWARTGALPAQSRSKPVGSNGQDSGLNTGPTFMHLPAPSCEGGMAQNRQTLYRPQKGSNQAAAQGTGPRGTHHGYVRRTAHCCQQTSGLDSNQ